MPHPFERRFKQKLRAAEAARFNTYGVHRPRRSYVQQATASQAVMQATIADRRKIIDLMTRAFISDPPSRFLYPEPEAYMCAFPRFVEGFAGAAFESDGVDHVANFSGAALWLPPDTHPDDKALDRLFEETIPAGRRAEVSDMIQQMSNYHPTEPHWHLAMMGVDPNQAHKGFGSALLETGLARVDWAAETAYLELTNPQNIPLYEKFGFKLVGTINTGRCPPIFPMVCRPA